MSNQWKLKIKPARKTWREKDHPRVAAGRREGGQFADKDRPVVRVTVKGGPGSGNFGHAGRPGQVGGSGPGSGGVASPEGYSPVLISDQRLNEAWNQLSPHDRLNFNVSSNMIYRAIEDVAPELIRKMGGGDEFRETAMQVVQDQETGHLFTKKGVGEWNKVNLGRAPDGYRIMGHIHTHPPPHPLMPSEPDKWKFNPMLRGGGIFAIGGLEDGRFVMNLWMAHPGDREMGFPKRIDLGPPRW